MLFDQSGNVEVLFTLSCLLTVSQSNNYCGRKYDYLYTTYPKELGDIFTVNVANESRTEM